MQGFRFLPYQYLGFLRTSKCSFDISIAINFIQNFSACLLAFSLPKNGVVNVRAVQSIH